MAEHLVRFYDEESFLLDRLGQYVGAALSNDDTAIAIATKSHLDQLQLILKRKGLIDGQGKVRRGHYQPVEADSQLALFMENGMPVESLFHKAIGNLIQLAIKRRPGHIYVFGEMVAIVSSLEMARPDVSRYAAAIEIERYFNRLIESMPFSLMCAYPLSGFPRLADGEHFATICALHSTVLPAETVDTKAALDTVQRKVAMLQQKAFTLKEEVASRVKVEESIREIYVDELTGLPNRALFHDRLEIDIKRVNRKHLALALLFIDLDNFKEINDTLGHEVGDCLLKQVANRLTEHIRDSDSVTRLGGDEFTVTLGELSDVDLVTDVADKILSGLARPFKLDGHVVYISASIGIAMYPQDASNVSDLLRNADQAMYESKAQGRNRFTYFTQSMQLAAQLRMCLSNDLRSAIENQQLSVHYQPIIDLATQTVHKAEALVRWEHPRYGMISPTEFIPIAEHTGLIIPIGNWVIQQVAHDMAQWRVRMPELTVSINVSPAQLHCADDDSSVLQELTRHHLVDPLQNGHLAPVELEITEGLLLGANPSVMNQVSAFQSSGLMITLDDFGTGYSSLSYLRKFKLNGLKIDRSFVTDLENDEANQSLCNAIIVMAHGLNMRVIAEGVEDPAQERFLINAGCDYAQGFLYGEALPPAQFESLIATAH